MSNNNDYLTINEITALQKAVMEPRDKAIIELFLNTGIFLTELVELKTDNIDWEKRHLKITGKRERTLDLNNQVYEALSNWTNQKSKTPLLNLFITTKGKANGLSARSVDNLIRKYAAQAGIKRNVNAQILRTTFAVRLFQQEISTAEATRILGISDPESIKRYIDASKSQPTPHLESASKLDHLDTRPKLTKFITNLFSRKPAITKKTSTLNVPITANPEELIIGRDGVTKEIAKILKRNQSLLLSGQVGVGLTHILKHMSIKLKHENSTNQRISVIYVACPTPIKQMLIEICEKIDNDWKEKVPSRPSTKELLNYVLNAKLSDTILIVDQLEKVRVPDQDMMISLIENFPTLGATHEQTTKLKKLWWKFQRLEVKPLDQDAAKALIKYLTQNLTISDYEMLETKILTFSNGLPLAISDMVKSLSMDNVVNYKSIQTLYHEAGTKYRDWSFIVIIIWGLIVASRFIALGSHSPEGYILAGFGTSILIVVRFFVRKMR
jgi:hypothetical protein